MLFSMFLGKLAFMTRESGLWLTQGSTAAICVPYRYRCPKNNKLVRATKRISIDDAPNVLTIHLKRFDFFGRGHKLSKKVEFGMDLDLGPYMTNSKAGGHVYDLYAVLVHHGHSLHSGHYVCYVKAANGMWHLCDDHRVSPSSQRVVEGQQAYILFYLRRDRKKGAAAAVVERAAAERVMQVRAAVQAQQAQQAQPAKRGGSATALVSASVVAPAAGPAGAGRADSGVHSLVASVSGANEGAVAAAAGRAGRVVAAAAVPAGGVRPATAAARAAQQQQQQQRKESGAEAGTSGRQGSAASGELSGESFG